MTKIEPGWYRDPAAPETQRYWDGEQWVGKPVGIDETPPDEPEPLPPPEPEPDPQAPTQTRNGNGNGDEGPVQVESALGPYQPGGPLARQLGYKSVERLLHGRTLANPLHRLVARIIDIAIVGVLAGAVNSWFLYQFYETLRPVVERMAENPWASAGEEAIPTRANELFFLILFITILVWFAYEVPSTVNTGQTLGKRLMRIQAIPLGGSKMRWSLAIARWSLMMLSLACFPFGMIVAAADGLWCTWDRPFRQCLHDKNAGTMVIIHSEGVSNVPPDASGS